MSEKVLISSGKRNKISTVDLAIVVFRKHGRAKRWNKHMHRSVAQFFVLQLQSK